MDPAFIMETCYKCSKMDWIIQTSVCKIHVFLITLQSLTEMVQYRKINTFFFIRIQLNPLRINNEVNL